MHICYCYIVYVGKLLGLEGSEESRNPDMRSFSRLMITIDDADYMESKYCRHIHIHYSYIHINLLTYNINLTVAIVIYSSWTMLVELSNRINPLLIAISMKDKAADSSPYIAS